MPEPAVSRETSKTILKDHFLANRALFTALVALPPVCVSHDRHSLAKGPLVPQWMQQQEADERRKLSDAKQAARRALDGVEKITVEQLLALDITRAVDHA